MNSHALQSWRAPDARELALIERLVHAASRGAQELLQQLQAAHLRQITEYADSPYSLEFRIPAHLPRADVPAESPAKATTRTRMVKPCPCSSTL